ncbi:S-adenosyl-L-methionine-dependent methyltransferase [Atractiella rhizophila]|nr:S-adenosyl-L-methionine-dependent methyltransferase [Atractiella rhizophila]
MLRLGLTRSSTASTSSTLLCPYVAAPISSPATRIFRHGAGHRQQRGARMKGPTRPKDNKKTYGFLRSSAPQTTSRVRWADSSMDVASMSPELIAANYAKWATNTPDLGYNDLLAFPEQFPPDKLTATTFAGPLSGKTVFDSSLLAKRMIKAWGLDTMEDLVVIECWAGVGTFTEELLKLPNLKKIVAIEDNRWSTKVALENKQIGLRFGNKLLWKSHDPGFWKSWSDPEIQEVVSQIPRHPWSKVHPNLFVLTHVSDDFNGEKFLYSCTTSTLPNNWLWRLGRFRQGFIHTVGLYDRIYPTDPTTPRRLIYPTNKLAILMSLIGSFRCTLDPSQFFPVPAHFVLPTRIQDGDTSVQTRRWMASEYLPFNLERERLWYDEMEHILTSAFSSRNKKISTSLDQIAHGASNILKRLKKKGVDIDENLWVVNLNSQQWLSIINEFHKWPFKPDVYGEGGWSWREQAEMFHKE